MFIYAFCYIKSIICIFHVFQICAMVLNSNIIDNENYNASIIDLMHQNSHDKKKIYTSEICKVKIPHNKLQPPFFIL